MILFIETKKSSVKGQNAKLFHCFVIISNSRPQDHTFVVTAECLHLSLFLCLVRRVIPCFLYLRRHSSVYRPVSFRGCLYTFIRTCISYNSRINSPSFSAMSCVDLFACPRFLHSCTTHKFILI